MSDDQPPPPDDDETAPPRDRTDRHRVRHNTGPTHVRYDDPPGPDDPNDSLYSIPVDDPNDSLYSIPVDDPNDSLYSIPVDDPNDSLYSIPVDDPTSTPVEEKASPPLRRRDHFRYDFEDDELGASRQWRAPERKTGVSISQLEEDLYAIQAAEQRRRKRISDAAVEIYMFLRRKKWAPESIQQVLSGRSSGLERALETSVGRSYPRRVEALHLAFTSVLEPAQTILGGPDDSPLLQQIQARLERYKNVIAELEHLTGSHLGRTGMVSEGIANRLQIFTGMRQHLVELEAEARELLGDPPPTIPPENEFRLLCTREHLPQLLAMGRDVADFARRVEALVQKCMEQFANGARQVHALSHTVDNLVQQAGADYAVGLHKEELEKRKKVSTMTGLQDAVRSIDTLDKMAAIGLGIGASYGGAYAPVFAAAGTTRGIIKRTWASHKSQRGYDELVERARLQERSLLGSVGRDPHAKEIMAKGTIERIELNFSLLMDCLQIPGSFIPGWGLISGAIKGVFNRYKRELERSVTPKEKSVGEELAKRIKDLAKGELVNSIVVPVKKRLGKLSIGSIEDRVNLTAPVLSPLVEEVLEWVSGIVLKAFPPSPDAWLTVDGIEHIVQDADRIPDRILALMSLSIPTPGSSGPVDLEEKKASGAPETLEGREFGVGRRWRFTALSGRRQLQGGWTRYEQAVVTYRAGNTDVDFHARVDIDPGGTNARMLLKSVRQGAETAAKWRGYTIMQHGYRDSQGSFHAGTWYQPFDSNYLFIGSDRTVTIVDPTVRVYSSGDTRPKSLFEILGTRNTPVSNENAPSKEFPMLQLGIPTNHGKEGSGTFHLQ
ncbi:hypothetical protein [Streptomyces sp. NPDC048419]|uniref:hypothetical protein n=1 Tax=Streptomyces sp. NPDC048419 TaxID=3365547 RepID=UPI00371C80E1